MKQPLRKSAKANAKPQPKKKLLRKANGKLDRKHPQFGTSKLEKDFAVNFLDKLGVKYIWQFEAKDIKRFFDYFILPSGPIIEVNGSYWHADPLLYEGKELTSAQKRNIRVDGHKKEWALTRGIPIYYVWEEDIRKRPSEVMDFLKSVMHRQEVMNEESAKKNGRHRNKIK